eukprot:7824172-Alexandrium_andersonii.AAC.1
MQCGIRLRPSMSCCAWIATCATALMARAGAGHTRRRGLDCEQEGVRGGGIGSGSKGRGQRQEQIPGRADTSLCLLYTSDAADDM